MRDLKATGAATVTRLDLLDVLVDYRNAISHGDDDRISAIEAAGGIAATSGSYQIHLRSLDALAGTIDSTVAASLARVLGTSAAW